MPRRSGKRMIKLPNGKTVERTKESEAEANKQLAKAAADKAAKTAKAKTKIDAEK